MAQRDAQQSRRYRRFLAWGLTLLILTVYVALPDTEEDARLALSYETPEKQEEPTKLEIVRVKPATVAPGSPIVIEHVGARAPESLEAFVGKEPLEIVARPAGAVVARLPSDLPVGRGKVRLAGGGERTKPYHVRIRKPNYRKPFRDVVGGFALLVFGMGVFARGAREASGLEGARRLARLASKGPAALGLGALVGGVAQSTTAAAGVLSGLVSSNLLPVVPAAIAFLGAQLGAASAPVLTGLIDSREGLVLIAIAVVWTGLASDRRSTAVSRFLLGVGFLAFGLQVMRPGLEPLATDFRLQALMASVTAEGPAQVALAALLGAALVAILQGPAPVLVLVLVLAQTTGHWDLRTVLAILSGSGLGAALGALLTTSPGMACRRLSALNLALGAASSLFAASTVGVWSAVADRLVAGPAHEVQWGERVLLPHFADHLAVAFALSQLAAALLMMPLAPLLERWLEGSLRSESPAADSAMPLDAARLVQSQLASVVASHRAALQPIAELGLLGRRDCGRVAEHALADARSVLSELLAGPVRRLPPSAEGELLARAAFACLGLGRSLEALLLQAERLTDTRLEMGTAGSGAYPLAPTEEATLKALDQLLAEGLTSTLHALEHPEGVDMEAARTREILMNGHEARARNQWIAKSDDGQDVSRHVAVLELVDAYEAAGNHQYRLLAAVAENTTAAGLAVAC